MDLLLTDPDRKDQMKRDIERKKENGKKKKSDNFIHAAKRKKLKSKRRLQGRL